MNTVDYALHLGGVITDEREEQDDEVRFCCDEMRDMVEIANAVVETARDAEELEQMTSDPFHVELRKRIANHECVPEFAKTIKNPQLREAWLESYRGG